MEWPPQLGHAGDVNEITASSELMGRRVLIVDADVPALRAATAWLREAGFETTAVSTFFEARAALDHTNFDILIADVRLGAFNGIHLVLLGQHRTPQIRAIVTHVQANSALEIEARRAGADEFLAKPITRTDLLHAVGVTAVVSESPATTPRRWPRVRLTERCVGRMADTYARLLDVSYGGLRVEVPEPRETSVGSLMLFELQQPPLAIHVRPLWLQPSAPGVGWYGAEIADPDPAAAGRWRSFVDSVAAA